MSSYNRRLFCLSVLGLAACGFTPAYGPSGGAGRLQGAIQIDEPDTHDGYLLTRDLETRLGRATDPAYGLVLSLDVTEDAAAITANNVTTRYSLLGRADYALRDLATGAIVTSGSVDSFTGYSASGTTVATQAASRDAHARLMTILADKIVTRLVAAAPDLPA